MFLKAGAWSLALLLASRLLGLARESAQAAAFGVSGPGDIAALMLSLPDWVAGVLASGALAYALVPAWAGRDAGAVQGAQRSVARVLLVLGVLLALATWALRGPLAQLLMPGLPADLRPGAQTALTVAACALPLALLAALWVTRLQHERDFIGMYGANLAVNAALVAVLVALASFAPTRPLVWLGAGLLAAMAGRLVWLRVRLPAPAPDAGVAPALPAVHLWVWAAVAAGLPLTLPFAARSIASGAGEGALAAFHYAWKLVELPLILAVQLVATLALPAIARAVAGGDAPEASRAIRQALALAWTLACAAAAGLVLAAPALATLLFGWGRMAPSELGPIAQWAGLGAWGLLPQALIAVATSVLAAQGRMGWAAAGFAAALAGLLATAGVSASGAALMVALNLAYTAVALLLGIALRGTLAQWLPGRALAAAALVPAVAMLAPSAAWPPVLQLGAAAAAAVATMALAAWASGDLRAALRR